MVYDVAVVGAGPAGAVFAREAAKNIKDIKIIVIDGETKEDGKVCGGLLAPDAQKLLAKFDLALPSAVLSDPQIFAVETIDLESECVRYYQRHYLNMDRYKFDKWLLSLIPNGVKIINGLCVSISRGSDGFELDVRSAESTEIITAKFIVGADGANSIVRRSFFKNSVYKYTAIQQWFETESKWLPYYSCIFDRTTSDSCSWAMRKGKYTVFGGAFKKQGCREAFEKQKTRLEDFIGHKLGDPVKTEACLVCSPRGFKDFETGGDGIFLIGEAAGFISASSFEGISSAILSGKMLADVFKYDDKHKKYKRFTRKLRFKLYLKTLKRTVLCNYTLRKFIMKTGVKSIKKFE